MPQATDELRAKFPGSIEQALAAITAYCTERNGIIQPRSKFHGRKMPKRAWDAIDYLIQEWDYAFKPSGAR